MMNGLNNTDRNLYSLKIEPVVNLPSTVLEETEAVQ